MERNYFERPLTPEDLLEFRLKKEKYDNSKVYTSEKDFVFIHKTNYAPNENSIKSTFESGAMYDGKGTLFNEDFSYTFPQGDNYIHFSINCEVSGNNEDIYGFNFRKYAIVMPGSDNLFSQMAFFHANDVEFKGVKDISDCYVLCPLLEAELIASKNPSIKVIPYVGEYVDGYAEVFASHLGYTIENTSGKDCMWINDSPIKTDSVLKKYNFDFIPFGMDRFMNERNVQKSLNRIFFLKKIVEIAQQRGINLFQIINSVEDILDDNLQNPLTPKCNLSLDITPTENEELNNFWKNYLNGNTSYERVILANFINQSLPYTKILEEYQQYKSDNKRLK